MEIIKSLDNKYIKNICKLNIKKYRDLENKFIVTLEHLVEEAYKSGNLLEVICLSDYKCDYDVKVTYVTLDVMKKITGMNSSQGIIGIVKKLDKKDIGNKVLLVDGVQDPGNMGTIIRSSVAFNIDTIILSKDSVDIYNDKVLRSSEGMIFNINLIDNVNLDEYINKLKDMNYLVYGTSVVNGINVCDIDNKNNIGIVIGNEGSGIRDNILELCDKNIYITMNSNCESLNVAVATSIILYELDK